MQCLSVLKCEVKHIRLNINALSKNGQLSCSWYLSVEELVRCLELLCTGIRSSKSAVAAACRLVSLLVQYAPLLS